MDPIEIFLVLLVAVCFTAAVAGRLKFPLPIAFVLAGISLAFIPGFPVFQIPPEAMLLIFLPVLLTESAYFTSIRDFKANLRPILQLALGLVVITAISIAYLMQKIVPGFGWAEGMVLGAIISAPDAVAATAIARQIRMPKRVQTILEGESLVNDASCLVIYKFAVLAVVTSSISVADASLTFLWMIVSGVTIGGAIGWIYMRAFPYIKEQSVEILSTFLVPYAAYLLAESVQSSGVLAVVTSGLVIGWQSPWRYTSAFRISAEAVWRMVTFVMNGLVFLLIGLHFPQLLRGLHSYDASFLIQVAALVSFSAIAVRFIWVYATTYGVRFMFPSILARDPYPSWQNVFIISWTGMRGVVSLATALALPVMISDGMPFPYRELIIFLAFSVILVTLVLQGLTLPFLLDRLSVTYDWNILRENWLARKNSAQAAMDKLQSMQKEGSVQSAALDRIVSHYNDRIESLGSGPSTPLRSTEPPSNGNHPLILMESKIWHDVLQEERQAILQLRKGFKISDDVMHEVLREIDLMYDRFKIS